MVVRASQTWNLESFVERWGYDAPYEVFDGELRDAGPCTALTSRTAALLGGFLGRFNEQHQIGETFAVAGFILSRTPLTLLGPPIAFVRAENIPDDYDFQGFYPGAPDLAADVNSPDDRPGEMADRIDRYIGAGTRLVWRVDPLLRVVEVHRAGQPSRVLLIDDVLDGEDVITGFRLPVACIFRELRRGPSTTERPE